MCGNLFSYSKYVEKRNFHSYSFARLSLPRSIALADQSYKLISMNFIHIFRLSLGCRLD
jgi:hypothetical protein